MALPENVGKGTVKGTFLTTAGTAVTGSVTLAASPARLLNASSAPPVTILPTPVTAELDADGAFTVQLVATDDADLNPHGWTYRASFEFTDVTAAPYDFHLPEGTTVDLTTVSQVAEDDGATIIQGPPGNPTQFELRGTGPPEGAVTADPGTYYTDTNGTSGAWRWLKTTSTGNTGWTVVYGDTGWRDISGYAYGPANADIGRLWARRVGDRVHVLIADVRNLDTQTVIISWPAGFSPVEQPAGSQVIVTTTGGLRGYVYLAGGLANKYLRVELQILGDHMPAELVFWTADPWSTELPGTPA